jgi:Flp pilus assembly protein TadB
MSMLKFLPGILVVQAATAALMAAALAPSASDALWVPLAALDLIVMVGAALWLASIAEHVKKDALSDAAARFAREREHIRVAAETDKRAALEDTHQRLIKETRRAQNKANLQLGLGLAGLLTLGGVMLAIEFMTMGLLIMATAGGALGGYLVRARQDARVARRNAAKALPSSGAVKAIEAERIDSPPR